MKLKLRIILVFFFIVLIALFILQYRVSEWNSIFDVLYYIYGFSSLEIAILTVFYVCTTSNQLDIMSKQLNEMKKDRELQNQPLPWLQNIHIEIEAPRFYFFPPKNRYCFQSRYWAFIKIINFSECPAISIDIFCRIVIKLHNGEEETLVSPAKGIDVLAGNAEYPQVESNRKNSFLFASDSKGSLFNLLRDTQEMPELHVNIMYKNVLGGCFMIEKKYYLLYPKNHESLINHWHTDIVSFPTKEKKRLENLLFLKKENPSKEQKEFNEIKNSYNYTEKSISILAIPIEGALNVMPLSTEEYDKIKNLIPYQYFKKSWA